MAQNSSLTPDEKWSTVGCWPTSHPALLKQCLLIRHRYMIEVLAVLGVEEVQTLGNAPFFPSSAAAA